MYKFTYDIRLQLVITTGPTVIRDAKLHYFFNCDFFFFVDAPQGGICGDRGVAFRPPASPPSGGLHFMKKLLKTSSTVSVEAVEKWLYGQIFLC